MGNSSKYSNVAVTKSRLFRPYRRVSCDYEFPTGDKIRLYEDFRSEEEAEFWAQAIRDGKWEPLNSEPSVQLRASIEHG